ncbi:MAG: ATP-binding protein, partial [Kiloniellales bacterium]|nr:ATP-binding protein [Kiloniellales bacterium]
DEEMVETIIENLLDNAIHFSPDHGTIFVELGPGDDKRSARFIIQDEGPGVPPEKLEMIFERYVSNRTAVGDPKSSVHFGLGLWIVQRNARAMGGTVGAANRKPHGLRVTVNLPRAV